MKHNSICFVIVLTIFFSAEALLGQIVIDKGDMPVKNDTVRISTGLNIELIDVSETGENITWDYSGLIPFRQKLDTFVSPGETPAGLLFSLISDFASRTGGNLPFPGFEISNMYQYYKSDNDAYKVKGFSVSLQGFPVPAPFSNPDILYKFPLTYGSSDSSHSGVEINVPETGFVKVDRHRKNYVDGWGTLITPYGTFEVIRVKSEVSEYDSVYIDSQEMGIGVPYSYTEYKWLGKYQKVPLLTVRDIVGGLVVEYVDSVRNVLNINEKQQVVNSVNFYPNPVNKKAVLEFELPSTKKLTVSLYDSYGNTLTNIFRGKINKGKHSFNIDFEKIGLAKGLYFLNLKVGKQQQSIKVIYKP